MLTYKDEKKIKHDMSELWKEIFHDSDIYISLVIDDDLDLDLCEWSYDASGRMTSMIIGQPRAFYGDFSRYKGLYLCGVSTVEYMRGKGEIQCLMRTLENKAKERGYDFTFLIPANERLRRYYSLYGYENMSVFSHLIPWKIKSDIDDEICDIIVRESSQNVSRIEANIMSHTDDYIRNILSDNKWVFNADYSAEKSMLDHTKKSLYIGKDILRDLSRYDSTTADIGMGHTAGEWCVVFKEWIISGKKICVVTEKCDDRIKEIWLYDENEKRVMCSSMDDMTVAGIRAYHKKSGTPYGMMRPLRDDLPKSDSFGLSLMLD